MARTVLSYGFIKPSAPDKGTTFFPDMESNFQQLNDHTHNGTNSALLTVSSVSAVSQAVTSAGWAAPVAGVYSQLVTLPAALTNIGGTFDLYGIEFRDTSNGSRLNLDMTKVSSTTFTIYCNDNTKNVTVVYH